MAYHKSNLDGLEKEYRWLDYYVNALKKEKLPQFFDHISQRIESLFLFLPAYVFITLLSLLIRKKSRLLQASLLRRYLQRFFYRKGIKKIFLTPPIDLQPGSLILMPRLTLPLTPLFYYQLFTTPIIIPVSEPLYHYRGVKSLIKRIAYPDGPLKQQKDHIIALLKKGYRVIFYLNPDYIDPMIHNRLYIDPLIKELISIAQETYVLNGSDLEMSPTASSESPLTVFISCKKLTTVIDPDDPDNDILSEKNKEQIADFFHYRYSEIIN
jgi:hypothetical protein